jgi:hypothetical protein
VLLLQSGAVATEPRRATLDFLAAPCDLGAPGLVALVSPSSA